VLPPRDPSTPPFRIPVRAPPAARPRASRPRAAAKRPAVPRTTRPRGDGKILWASVIFWLTVFPMTSIIADQLARGHDLTFHIIAGVWFTLVDGIIYLAAILIFRPNKTN
jgi:hypothetical protein